MLKSDQLYLEDLNQNDSDLFIQIFQKPNLIRYVGERSSREELLQFFNSILDEMSQHPPLRAFYKIKKINTNETMGIISLHWNQESRSVAELGTIILEEFQRKRVAQQARLLLLTHAFNHLGVEKILGATDFNNTAVNKMNEKYGSVIEKIFYNDKRKRKEIIWAITQENFEKANSNEST